MLILSRRIGERITIGDNIEVLICNVRGGRVRLGILAPVEIPVHRIEVYDEIQNAKCSDPTNQSRPPPFHGQQNDISSVK